MDDKQPVNIITKQTQHNMNDNNENGPESKKCQTTARMWEPKEDARLLLLYQQLHPPSTTTHWSVIVDILNIGITYSNVRNRWISLVKRANPIITVDTVKSQERTTFLEQFSTTQELSTTNSGSNVVRVTLLSTDAAVDAIKDQEGRDFWDQCPTFQELYTTNSNNDMKNNSICVNSNEGGDIDCPNSANTVQGHNSDISFLNLTNVKVNDMQLLEYLLRRLESSGNNIGCSCTKLPKFICSIYMIKHKQNIP
jgi:hypothetical protein